MTCKLQKVSVQAMLSSYFNEQVSIVYHDQELSKIISTGTIVDGCVLKIKRNDVWGGDSVPSKFYANH